VTSPILRNSLQVQKEKAVLLAVELPRQSFNDMDELEKLAETAGAEVVLRMVQKRSRINSELYLGRGKVREISDIIKKKHIDVAIVDDDLTAIQIRNLEKVLQIKVIDRSELILGIFATHARSRQAKMQVELAQLEYGISRLRRLWTHLERQEGVSGASVATRGPGEKQIEVDRRLARKRISELKKKLVQVSAQGAVSRRSRRGLFKVSLVGYTNAGKSTLLRALTGQKTLIQDQLFSTLDTLTRRLDNAWPPCLVSDTVGFIRKLPRHLLSAFESTLKEVVEADLLLLVLDAADAFLAERLKVLLRVLRQIKASEKVCHLVFNKIDQLDEEGLKVLKSRHAASALFVSALKGDGLGDLRNFLHEKAGREACPVCLSVPAGEGQWVSEILKKDRDHEAKWKDDQLCVKLCLPEAELQRYEKISAVHVKRLDGLQAFEKNHAYHYTSKRKGS
jgi:GTP-binding protein HflX